MSLEDKAQEHEAQIWAINNRPREVASYKPGNYQGKSDIRPWEGGQFAGNKDAWSAALASRAQNQNEYKKAQ